MGGVIIIIGIISGTILWADLAVLKELKINISQN